jgi:hypothetical protein
MAGYDVYPTSSFISSLGGVPVVGFVHGAKDKRAPIEGAKRMADKVIGNGSGQQTVLTMWDPHADHNDLPFRKRFSNFLRNFVATC